MAVGSVLTSSGFPHVITPLTNSDLPWATPESIPLKNVFKSYNPGACRESWVSYLRDDISLRYEAYSYDRAHCPDKTITISTTSTITRSATSECDQSPRAISVGESVMTTTAVIHGLHACYWENSSLPKHFPDNFRDDDERLRERPDCTILPSDCGQQWEQFRAIFTNTTVPFNYAYGWDNFTDPKPLNYNTKTEEIVCGHDGKCRLVRKQDFWAWVAGLDSDNQQRVGFFADCPDAEATLRRECFKTQTRIRPLKPLVLDGLSPQSINEQIDTAFGCEIKVDRFALIYFDPQKPLLKNICANHTKFEPEAMNGSTTDLPYSTVLTAITFHAHDIRSSRQSTLGTL
jgi:hypothetical protein